MLIINNMPWDSAGQFFPSAVIRHCFQRDSAQRVLMESCKDGNHINQVLGLSQLQVSFCLWLWNVDKILICDGAIHQGLCNNDFGVQTGCECRSSLCW